MRKLIIVAVVGALALTALGCSSGDDDAGGDAEADAGGGGVGRGPSRAAAEEAVPSRSGRRAAAPCPRWGRASCRRRRFSPLRAARRVRRDDPARPDDRHRRRRLRGQLERLAGRGAPSRQGLARRPRPRALLRARAGAALRPRARRGAGGGGSGRLAGARRPPGPHPPSRGGRDPAPRLPRAGGHRRPRR